MRYVDINNICIAVDYTISVILTSKCLIKLDNLWMQTAVAPLEDIAWTVAYKSLFLLFSREHIWCVFIVVSDLQSDSLRWKKLKLAPYFQC